MGGAEGIRERLLAGWYIAWILLEVAEQGTAGYSQRGLPGQGLH